MRVLLVEDADALRHLFARVLKANGFDVREAANGQEALDCLPGFQPDIVVTDLMMPIVDGFELIRQLRAMPMTAIVPVVVMTAGAACDTEHQARGVRGRRSFWSSPSTSGPCSTASAASELKLPHSISAADWPFAAGSSLIRCLEKISPRSSMPESLTRSWPFFTTAMKPSHISSLTPGPHFTALGGCGGCGDGGVVEVRDDLDDRALGNRDRLVEIVGVLPGRVPVRNMDQVLGPSVRELDEHPHVVPEHVHVRRHGQRLDVGGDEPAPLDLDIRLAGRQLELEVRRLVPVQRLADRLPGIVHAEPRAVDLGLAAGMVVDLNDDVGLERHPDPHPPGKMAGLVPRVPEAELLEVGDPRSRERDVTRPLLGLVALGAAPVMSR